MTTHAEDPRYWTKTLKALRPKMRSEGMSAPTKAMIQEVIRELARIDRTLHRSLEQDGELQSWATVTAIRVEQATADMIASGVDPFEAAGQAWRDVVLNYDPNQPDDQDRRESEQLPL